MSSVTLQKNSSINLNKAASDAGATAPLTKLVAGAGWDAKDGRSIDLDLMAVYIGEDGKAIPDANNNGQNADEALIFFNNLSVPGAQHSGDNLTGEGDGDDEKITFDLNSIPSNVKEVAVVVASYSGETFGEVENAFVRMVNSEGDTELAKFELKDGMASTKGVELGRITRNGSEWEFKATGENISGDFNQVVASYGVN